MSRRCGGREAMTATAPKYEPAWLQGDDVFDAFEAAGIDPPAAVEWLAGAHNDRGLALADDAEPSRDLFRLPWGASLDNSVSVPSFFGDFVGRIDWQALTVNALFEGHYMSVPVEVSRMLLAELLPKSTGGKSKGGRPRRADQDAAQEALRLEIKRRGWPDDDNADPKWRHQTHVEEWLREFFSSRKEAIRESRTREITVDLLNKLKAGN
jgi:hypothetical protein